VDAGPIVMQKKCIIEEFDTAETLKLKVQKLEGDAYIETLELLHSNIIGKNNNNIYLGMIKNKY
jgi:phosphoribosylglycinamide formyltransferase-1